MDRLDAMRVFVRVAEMGSFSAVAQQMDVARSVVTRQIAGLEAHLGSKLIARSTRKLSLTSAGAAYLERCREILNLIESAENSLVEANQTPRGQIRVSVPFSFGLNTLMPLLSCFLEQHPDISLELDFSDRRSNLIEAGLDLAIRITSRLDPTDVARKIGSDKMQLLGAPAYLEKHGRPQHPRELIDHECFGYVLSDRANLPFYIDGELQWFPIRGRLSANNGDALLDAAMRGLGLTFAPTFIGGRAVREGKLEVLLPDFPTRELSIYAIYPGNRYVPHRVRVLVDYLAERLNPAPW